MRKLFTALAAAFIVAGLFMSPVTAAPPTTSQASEDCGDTYTVQSRDYLARIARTCGTTVSSILALNPQITNPNLVYTGMVLRLTDSAPYTYANFYKPFYSYYSGYAYSYTYNPYNYQNSTTSRYAKVTLSDTSVAAGDDVTVTASRFPANSEIDFRLYEEGEETSAIVDGTVDSEGNASQEFSIPSDADEGGTWYVLVLTTSQADIVEVTSHSIHIED